MRVIWILLLIGGLAVWFGAISMWVSGAHVSGIGDIANADLLAQRSDRIHIACALWIMAAVVFAADSIRLTLRALLAPALRAAAEPKANRTLSDLAKDDNRRGTVA